MVFAALCAASVLAVIWIFLLLGVSREDWRVAAYNRMLDNVREEDALLRQDAKNRAKLEQYQGIVRAVMGQFLDTDSSKKIAKLRKQSAAIQQGRLDGVNVLEMPGYALQRLIPALGGGVLFQKIRDQSQELYGKKYALYKAKQTLARVLACPIPGLAVSLTVGALLCTVEMRTQGLVVMGLGSVAVLFVTYAFYDDVGDNLNKRRSAIARQFPNVVSKMALLVTSGMIVDRAWRETAMSQELELYQEMRRTADELDNNVPPVVAYMNFIDRCNTKETTKLASAIIQSQSKGNAEIGVLLKSLSHDAWEERQHQARRDSEAANSKLMIPTMLLFLAIMVMIVVPAMMSIDLG